MEDYMRFELLKHLISVYPGYDASAIIQMCNQYERALFPRPSYEEAGISRACARFFAGG